MGSEYSLGRRFAPYIVIGILLIALLEGALHKSAGVIWMAPLRAVAYSHALLVDAVLRGLSGPWGSLQVWLLVTYVAIGVTGAVVSEKFNPPPSSARWLRALIVWLVALGGLSFLTIVLGWMGILTV